MAFQFQSRYVVDLDVVFIYHMQDDVIVGFVVLVSVAVPVGRFHMDFHMSRPEFVANLDFGFKEVRTRVSVAVTSRDNVNGFAFRGLQILVGQAVFPEII